MPAMDPALDRARRRNRAHMKRTAVSDITHGQELAMRARARKCPLCDVRMTDKPHLPNSKELDHILPVNQGGTHTHGNVRIICRKCNQSRPKDGSDYTGMLTLWAQGPAPVSRTHGMRVIAANRKTCRKGLHPWIPANITIRGDGKKRCAACKRESEEQRGVYRTLQQCKCGAMYPARGNQFTCPACIDVAARKAAELHASGLSWAEVAREIGYGSHNGEGARYAAKRIGYSPPPGLAAAKARARAKPRLARQCPDCGTPKPKHAQRCDACLTGKAWRAVEMRFEQGHTLRHIADQLGYDSITSVTNLLKTVVTIESRMGRPSAKPDIGTHFVHSS